MLKVIKIGGNIVDNPTKLEKFLSDFAALEGQKILIHGGGKVATSISTALGIETQMISGRRVTDKQTLGVVTMVYAGGINKSIVGALRSLGCDAFGMCGVDGGVILSNKRSPEPIDYGFVGDPIAVNDKLLNTLINSGLQLVIAPITANEKGELLNTNADTVAQSIATGMALSGAEVELIYCFEKKGVLSDVNDDNSVIETITPTNFESLKADGIVADGMLPKLENAFKALEKGVKKVVICSAESISEQGYAGTSITK
ncbi:MAG: acetylglutamate kinase [Rikenellaceae bacterium]